MNNDSDIKVHSAQADTSHEEFLAKYKEHLKSRMRNRTDLSTLTTRQRARLNTICFIEYITYYNFYERLEELRQWGIEDMNAVELVYKENPMDLLLYIELGGNPNAQDKDGMTVLHHACATGARDCVRALVASERCDYLLQTKSGQYASEIAIIWSRDFAVARLLANHEVSQSYEHHGDADDFDEKDSN